MNIGIDARPLTSSKPSGIGNYLRQILSFFIEKDKSDSFFLFSNKPLSSDIVLSCNFHPIIVNGKIGTLVIRFKITKELKKHKIDVFWGTEHILPKKISGISFVLTVHDLALLVNPHWGSFVNSFVQNTIGKKSIKEANRIIADSESTKDDLSKLLHIKNSKISVIRLGYIKQTVALTKQSPIVTGLIPYFLFIGTIEPRKNLVMLIKGFNLFRNMNKEAKQKLVLCGGMGWKTKEIKKEIKLSPFSNDIILTGYVTNEEKQCLLNNCQLFVFPSNYEGFGLPLLEAMNCGKPIIAANNSSISEIGKDLFFYLDDNQDPLAYSLSFKKVISLSENEKEKINKKEEKALANYSWENCSKETLSIIKKAINE